MNKDWWRWESHAEAINRAVDRRTYRHPDKWVRRWERFYRRELDRRASENTHFQIMINQSGNQPGRGNCHGDRCE